MIVISIWKEKYLLLQFKLGGFQVFLLVIKDMIIRYCLCRLKI